MKNRNLKTLLGLLALALTAVGFVGCSGNDSGGTPPTERKPGQDISPQDRADKRGDVPVAPGANGK
jgi:hypothetical protein